MVDGPVAARRVVADREDSEDCWSDGETFISLNKRILHDLASGRHSFGKAVNILTRAYLRADIRSEEHTSELQSLMRISYAVFCLKKKKTKKKTNILHAHSDNTTTFTPNITHKH